MATYKIKSYAKINLALNIVGKTSSLHKIETIVAFIDLFDDILIEKIKSKDSVFWGFFAAQPTVFFESGKNVVIALSAFSKRSILCSKIILIGFLLVLKF